MERDGLFLLGFLHSHPNGYEALSKPDIDYFSSQFDNIPVEKFLTPIIFSIGDGQFDIIPYLFNKNGPQIQKTNWQVIPDEDLEPIQHDVEDSQTEEVRENIPAIKLLSYRTSR